MLIVDGIIFHLQRAGGISVMFTEILSRLPPDRYRLVGFRERAPERLPEASYHFQPPRRVERYRRASLRDQADIFHSTYYRLPSVRGPKVVTTVYDFVYERFASLPRRLVHGLQKRAAIDGADRIICISESTRSDLLSFMGSRYADRTVVVHPAGSTEFRPVPEAAVLPQVLFVGKRDGYKNFRAVVEAIAPLRDLRLVCVGGGDFTAEEQSLLKRHLPHRYVGTGYLSDAALNVEYNRSLCLAYPSLYEGFGIPVLEAMRAGCPVVAVRVSSIPEVAGDAAVLLDRGDPDEIRAAIASLMVSETRAAVVTRGSERALRFNWDETYARTVRVYEDLVGRPIADW